MKNMTMRKLMPRPSAPYNGLNVLGLHDVIKGFEESCAELRLHEKPCLLSSIVLDPVQHFVVSVDGLELDAYEDVGEH